MNKRIQELAEQAWDATAVSPEFGHPVSFAEKFAELLIAAVMAEVRDEVQYEYDWTIADIVTERVKKTFVVTQ